MPVTTRASSTVAKLGPSLRERVRNLRVNPEMNADMQPQQDNPETGDERPTEAETAAQPHPDTLGMVDDIVKNFSLVIEENLRAELAQNDARTRDELAGFRVRLANFERQQSRITADVAELRRDVNHLLESANQPTGDNPQVTLDIEERTARVIRRLERVELTVREHASLIGDSPQPIKPANPEDQMEIHDSSKSRKESRKSRKSRRNRRNESSSSDSDSDDSSSESEVSSSSESSDHRSHKSTRGGILSRKRGKKLKGLREIRPTNSLYDKLLSYRTYRMRRRSKRRSGRETAKVKDHVRRMQLAARDLSFDGSDPILILRFLARFIEEADMLEMSEAQAYIAVTYFLKGEVLRQFRAATYANSRDGGITCWPEAVQYLLRSYATNAAISQALLDLRDTRQKSGETETEYSTRIMDAEYRCGNVHTTDERMTMFVDGLDSVIRPLVARYREEQRDRTRRRGVTFTYLDLVKYAQDEGDAHRARTGASGRRQLLTANTTWKSPPRPKRRDDAMLAQSSADSRDIPSNNLLSGHEPVGLVDHTRETNPTWTELSPTGSYTVPSTAEPILISGQSVVHPQPISMQEHSPRMAFSRPGWVQNRRVPAKQPRTELICHSCYEKGHASPDCLLPWRDLGCIVTNYERLTADERTRVPTNSYERAQVARAHRDTPPRFRNSDKEAGQVQKN